MAYTQTELNSFSGKEAADLAEIQKIVTTFADGWDQHDVALSSSIFSEDADHTNVMGKLTQGRQAIEAFHGQFFKTVWKNSTLHVYDTRTRFFEPTIASLDARWELSNLLTPEGNERSNRIGIFHLILQKQANGWKVVVMHNLDLTPR